MNIKSNLAMSMLLACLTVPIATNVYADGATLSLTEAQHLALARSQQLLAQDATASANREMAVAAGQLPDPVLKVGIDNLPVDGQDKFSIGRDFMTMRRVGISQEFTRSDKRQLRAALYQGEVDKTLAEKTVTMANIQRDTALAWIDRFYAEAMATAVSEQVKAIQLEIVAAESAYRSGKGTQADVFAAHIALANLEDQLSAANQKVRTTTINLGRWIGDDTNKPLSGKPEINAINLDTNSLENTLSHHPKIAVLTEEEKIAETAAQLAQANKKSDWNFEVSYAQRGPDFSNMISAGVSIPLQWDQKNRQDRDLAAKLAMVEQIKAEREEMLREHISEISAMEAEWKNDRERLQRYQQTILPLATERTRAMAAAYQGGKSSLSDLLLTRRNEIDTHLQALQLETDTAKLWAQLNFLIPEQEMHMHQANDKDIK